VFKAPAFLPLRTTMATGKKLSTLAIDQADRRLAIVFAPVSEEERTEKKSREQLQTFDFEVQVLDALNLERICSTTVPHAVTDVAFSRDGTRLAIIETTGIARVIETKQCEQTGFHSAKGVMRAASSASAADAIATVSNGGGVRVFNPMSENSKVSEWSTDARILPDGAITPNGQEVAIATLEGTIELWSAIEHRKLHEFAADTGAFTSVGISPDGSRLAAGTFDRVVLWDLTTRLRIHEFKLAEEIVGLRFVDRARLVVICAHRIVQVDIPDSSNTTLISRLGDAIDEILVSADSQRALVRSAKKESWLFDFSGDRPTASKADANEVMFDEVSGRILKRSDVGVKSGPESDLIATAYGFVAVDKNKGTIASFDRTGRQNGAMALGGKIQAMISHSGAYLGVVIAGSGALSTSKVFSLQNGLILSSERRDVENFWFLADGELFATSAPDHSIQIGISSGPRSAAPRKLPQTIEGLLLPGHISYVSDVAVSHDFRSLYSVSWDGTLRAWDLSTGRERYALRGHSAQISSVAVSPDAALVASASWDGTIIVRGSTTGAVLATLGPGLKITEIYRLAFAGKGEFLIAGDRSGDAVVLRVGSVGPEAKNWLALNLSSPLPDIGNGEQLPFDCLIEQPVRLFCRPKRSDDASFETRRCTQAYQTSRSADPVPAGFVVTPVDYRGAAKVCENAIKQGGQDPCLSLYYGMLIGMTGEPADRERSYQAIKISAQKGCSAARRELARFNRDMPVDGGQIADRMTKDVVKSGDPVAQAEHVAAEIRNYSPASAEHVAALQTFRNEVTEGNRWAYLGLGWASEQNGSSRDLEAALFYYSVAIKVLAGNPLTADRLRFAWERRAIVTQQLTRQRALNAQSAAETCATRRVPCFSGGGNR
jgi:WD40 repeat protein